MPYGYNGKILRVNLSQGNISVEEPEENFYRRYLGGRGFVGYYLLKELKPGVEPLGPENKLIFAAGVVNGAQMGGGGRNSVGAKSPLTGAYGDGEVGGFFGAELKRAGYDAIICEGKAPKPVYLWIDDGKAEIRDAGHLWGKTTGEVEALIREELGDNRIRIAQTGPAGEKLVRYACVINDVNRAAGRTGLGAVMGSKNLKAVAARAHNPLPVADAGAVRALAKWLGDNVADLAPDLHELGTGGWVWSFHERGFLPTRNFQEGHFEGADKISAQAVRSDIRVGMDSCYACSVRCKKVVEVKEPYAVDRIYGGPEYETLASMGSNCGVDDLKAIAKANEICNAYGLDTISTGVTVSFAMECFERGLLTEKDTDGLKLSFGNAPAMVQVVEMIARREGIGDLLAEGSLRAAQKIGGGAIDFAMQVKGQEIPLHAPRPRKGRALGYAISPTGAEHNVSVPDTAMTDETFFAGYLRAMGLLQPLPLSDLSPAKIRALIYYNNYHHLLDALLFCEFVPLDLNQLADLTRAVTGWNTTTWELLKAGERCANLARAFNMREGFGKEDDVLPPRCFTPFTSGPLKGVSLDREEMERARDTYYAMMGWDSNGVPTLGKLQELDIEWVAEELGNLMP